MQNIIAWSSIVCLCLGGVGTVQADQTTEVQKSLQAKYNQSDAAYTRGDITEYLSIFAVDCVGIEDGGFVMFRNRSELYKIVRHEIRTKHWGQHSSIVKITLHENRAIVRVLEEYSRNGQYIGQVRHEDLWQKARGRWRLKQSQTLEI